MIFQFTGILQRAADNQRIVAIPAATLGNAISELAVRHPRIGQVLLDNTGQLRQAHRLLLNGELIPRPKTDLMLAENDHVEFLTAIAGG